MRKNILRFLICALTFMGLATPAWAVDWSTLGSEVVANSEYYIYNINQGKFMIEKALGGVDEAICFKAEASGTKFKFKYGSKYISRPTNTWGTNGLLYLLTQFDEINHKYYIIRQTNGTPTDPTPENFYYKASSATTIAESSSNATPDADCQWVFIPKATFDANKWLEVAATVEADGEYYIYNINQGKFMIEKALGGVDEAICFKAEASTSGTKFKFKYGSKYISRPTSTWGTSGLLYLLTQFDEINHKYYIIRQTNGTPTDPTPENFYYKASSATTIAESSSNATPDADCEWLFIPKASFDALVPAAEKEIDREDEWTAVSVAAPTSNGFYYLYNPASQCFLGNAKVTNDPEQAVMFYSKYSSNKYTFVYSDQAALKYVRAATSWTTSSQTLTLTEKSSHRYHMAYVTNSATTYLYATPSGTSYTLGASATPNEYSRWVFIPRDQYVSKMAAAAASAPTDKWLAKAVSPGEGGLFYLYNPASKRFMQEYSLSSTQSWATLYNVSKSAENTYSIMYSTDDGENIKYVDAAKVTSSWQGDSKMSLTINAKTSEGKTNRFTIKRTLSNVVYHLVSSKTSATNYGLNFINCNATNYPYAAATNVAVVEGDLWNEWMFIPASAFEAEIATAPSGPDTWDSQGSEPEIGKQYFLYNIEAQRFFKRESLTANTEEAALCTIGGTDEAKNISFVHPGVAATYYVIAKSGGYSTSSYVLDWDETEADSKQYFIYHQVTDEMGPQLGSDPMYDYQIYLRSNKTYTSPEGVAIQTGERPADINGKFKWAFIEPAATLYYSANTEVYAGQGDVYVYFGTPGLSASTGVISEGSLSASLTKKATFMAVPETGYQFMGWKTDPEGGFISTNALYEHALTVSSTDSEHPDNVTLYAYFEKYDAEVYNTSGIKQGDYETLAAAITAASKGYTVKLKRNITSAQTINKGVTIDFNGYTISDAVDNLVTVSAPSTDTVTFVDNSIAGNGGIKLAYSEAEGTSSYTALKVTAGTLVINNGIYDAAHTWTGYEQDGKAYVLNCAGGKVRVNAGYFKATKYGAVNQVTNYVHLFNGSNITLYGGLYACGAVSDNVNNVSSKVAGGIEAVNSGDAVYNIKLQSSVASNAVATVNGVGFMSLADAIAYTNNNAGTDMVIRLAKDHTLPAGTYTIPAKTTLIIPYNALHTEPVIACPLVNSSRLPSGAYRTLTLANGVHIDVFGAIELGGCAYSYGNGAAGTGRPNSDYGHLIMEGNSQIVLNNGARFRAWGFVTGSGGIDVRRGARVDEMFQVYDFKGGNGTLAMYTSGHKSFPIQQYFIQNVEVKTTYRPGSALYGTMAAVATGMSVKIIGKDGESSSLFMMNNEDDSEDTWVRKWYDSSTDQQVYDINNSAKISNLFLPLSKITGVQGSDFDSKEYILPITNNMKIHLLSGDMYITQDVAFLPGAELEINKLCTGHVNKNTTTYFYDSDEWGPYTYNNVFASKIKYRPGGVPNVRNISSADGLGDAKANIHGTIEVNGSFRATEGGANIYSTNEDAGTVSFTADAVTTYVSTRDTLCTWTSQVYHPASSDNNWQASATPSYTHPAAYPAKLQNASGFTSTTTDVAGANAGKSFCYINGEWRLLTDAGCMVTDGANYYIKPREYVQLSSEYEDPVTHLYHNVGNTREFILTSDLGGNCQWWEVEDVADHLELKHSIHPENDVYYEYSELDETWIEKRFTIAWRNWDGTLIESYEMKMGAKLQYLGSTPQREKTDYYTYDFAGWSPAITTDAVVTGNATYTAQFSQTDRMYLITFINTNPALGDLINESQYLRMGEVPTSPDLGMSASTLTWTPAISPVTGNADYTLTMADMFATSYTIKFVNWNGAELQSGTVDAGETPVYAGATPVKPAIDDEIYSFAGWTPAIAPATADAVYMAKFDAERVRGWVITDVQTISDTREVIELRITTSGSLSISGSLTTGDFYIESDGTHSGELTSGAEKLHINGNAYFDFKVNAQNHKWYAVAVPWQVDAASGISVNGKTLTLSKDFDLIYYDGARRAAEGKQKCWSYVAAGEAMQPGRLYMIGLMMDAPVIRFAKKEDAALLTTEASVQKHAQTTGDDKDANWNGVANPALFHAYVNAGTTVGQVYNPDNNSYAPITMSEAKMVVGQGAFVQAPADQTITVSVGGAFGAPRRAKAEANTLYDVRIAPAGAQYTDRLFVTVDEEKEEDKYVIGQDLAKVGVSKQVAQMWVSRYNTELCLNTMAPVNGEAEYPLGISVPQAGEYTISTNSPSHSGEPEGSLYLTKDGRPVWNLSYGEYVLNLERGTTTGYGLRIVTSNAPQTATGVETITNDELRITKILLNGQVYILRGGNVYTIDGQLLK
ncbi:MAG: hypothetical protein IJP45_01680 [Paludibacteraceae bacterium]|nr:hypothetical protein [Paludibacteraceae bacterium]